MQICIKIMFFCIVCKIDRQLRLREKTVTEKIGIAYKHFLFLLSNNSSFNPSYPLYNGT